MPRQRPKATPRTGSKILRVGPKTVAQLENPNYQEWEDDELIAGYQRDHRGQFNGSRPKVVPRELLMELNRRVISKGMHTMYRGLIPAIEYMVGCADGTVIADKDRMHACEVIMNRCLGLTPQTIQVSTTAETPYERAGVTRAIVLRSSIDVDSEEADNPFEED